MKKITVVLPYNHQPEFAKMLRSFWECSLIETILILHGNPPGSSWPKCRFMGVDSLISGRTWHAIIHQIQTQYFLVFTGDYDISIAPDALKRFLDVAESTGAGLVFSDYYEEKAGQLTEHPVNDCQTGSIRDHFDFGPAVFFSTTAVHEALDKYGPVAETTGGGFYDVRLKVSIDTLPFHISEFLYTQNVRDPLKTTHEEHFDYVDPQNHGVQQELEQVATQHLKRIGAYLDPPCKKAPPPSSAFPVEASVIIPVRNRKRTIADAVHSALSQKTNFAYNVIVVDNHSTDGTTAVLSDISVRHSGVKHIIPSRLDLNIGGCWNEAITFKDCGRYAVQLDSDDLYSGPDTLQKMVDVFRKEAVAMVIGSYTIVNESLDKIPPGLIDHREWSDDNGHNNALRINGLGAPRAFDTALIREIGFLNVGYGEDYALALRLCREYRIGRIYESLYLCRRWSGNTDADLSLEKRNRNDSFKDKIRTIEIMARQKLNREKALAEY